MPHGLEGSEGDPNYIFHFVKRLQELEKNVCHTHTDGHMKGQTNVKSEIVI